MTKQQIAAQMYPLYAAAKDNDEKRDILEQWNALLELAEPDPPPPDDFQVTIDKAVAEHDRSLRPVRRRA